MKKIIQGKLYDTDKAKMVAGYSAPCGRSDFHYYEEELYRKRTGEFFLYGYGHADSKYGKPCGQNEWCAGEQIVPITYDDAQAWMEEHGSAEQYAAVFGVPSDDDGTVVLGLAVSAQAAAKLKQEAARRGVSQGDLLDRWIMSAE